jgi:hypothetical protein
LLENDDKKWSRIIYFETEQAPSELRKNQRRKVELAWQVSGYL